MPPSGPLEKGPDSQAVQAARQPAPPAAVPYRVDPPRALAGPPRPANRRRRPLPGLSPALGSQPDDGSLPVGPASACQDAQQFLGPCLQCDQLVLALIVPNVPSRRATLDNDPARGTCAGAQSRVRPYRWPRWPSDRAPEIAGFSRAPPIFWVDGVLMGRPRRIEGRRGPMASARGPAGSPAPARLVGLRARDGSWCPASQELVAPALPRDLRRDRCAPTACVLPRPAAGRKEDQLEDAARV